MENCLKCGTKLETSSGKGRPATYCSPACRRSAEMEIRRVDQSLSALERDAQNYRLGRIFDFNGADAKNVDAEINRLEARLKLLLSAE